MKYCYQCGRVTTGEALFCQFCGRTYNVKLCPRQHVNPRYAEVCSQCGSRELSTPQPKVSFWWRVLEFLVRILCGIGLVYLSLSILVALLKSPMVQAGLLGLGLVLLIMWALWIMLPEWFRKLVRWAMTRKERRHDR
jgi:RNA polymerase subunit RPABC4/transcription elongation factor Spt4